jgi:hypothetical protein
MENESKLFICGITSYETEKISELIQKTKDYFDGFVWCVDSAPHGDKTFELLEQNKKEGKIVRHPWINAFDWQMNEWLYSGIIKNGDWCYIADSSSYPTEFWMKQMRENIKQFESKNIHAVYCSGCPFLFRFTDYLWFLYSPHWSLQGLIGNIITIPEEEKTKYIYNARLDNPDKHFQEHDTRNYITYGRNNQILAFYGRFGQEIVNRHEQTRRWFRDNLRVKTGLEPGLKALDVFFKNNIFTQKEEDIIESEFCLSEYYQRVILRMNFMGTRPEITNGMHPRYKWSFKNHLKFGDGWCDKEYKGTILKYNHNEFPK